jgi:hypothetical protein
MEVHTKQLANLSYTKEKTPVYAEQHKTGSHVLQPVEWIYYQTIKGKCRLREVLSQFIVKF